MSVWVCFFLLRCCVSIHTSRIRFHWLGDHIVPECCFNMIFTPKARIQFSYVYFIRCWECWHVKIAGDSSQITKNEEQKKHEEKEEDENKQRWWNKRITSNTQKLISKHVPGEAYNDASNPKWSTSGTGILIQPLTHTHIHATNGMKLLQNVFGLKICYREIRIIRQLFISIL